MQAAGRQEGDSRAGHAGQLCSSCVDAGPRPHGARTWAGNAFRSSRGNASDASVKPGHEACRASGRGAAPSCAESGQGGIQGGGSRRHSTRCSSSSSGVTRLVTADRCCTSSGNSSSGCSPGAGGVVAGGGGLPTDRHGRNGCRLLLAGTAQASNAARTCSFQALQGAEQGGHGCGAQRCSASEQRGYWPLRHAVRLGSQQAGRWWASRAGRLGGRLGGRLSGRGSAERVNVLLQLRVQVGAVQQAAAAPL